MDGFRFCLRELNVCLPVKDVSDVFLIYTGGNQIIESHLTCMSLELLILTIQMLTFLIASLQGIIERYGDAQGGLHSFDKVRQGCDGTKKLPRGDHYADIQVLVDINDMEITVHPTGIWS